MEGDARNFDNLEAEQRIQEKLMNTIAIFDPRKKIPIRKESKKNILNEDERLIRQYLLAGNIEALLRLIDCYTPFIKSMVWSPFKSIKGKARRRLSPLQIRVNRFKTEHVEYQYVSSMAHDIISEALVEFCQLVHSYCWQTGSFSGYVKNYLPLRMERIFRQIVSSIESVYLDGLPEESKELFELQYLSCMNLDAEEKIELEQYNLTEKQREVAILLSEGYNDAQTAKMLGISRQAVMKHKDAIKKKMRKFRQTAN
ncbi:LuxR C-terminal-related transcriptional regulator [Paenibacillus flagellatus]|uniref:LuxR C-terminal-related transcriptional regulator n=1 Tax=Paenibacillus flagellatus TaxID=2211139 RepID=UPI0013051BC4|nr:hypothetical protein [Paenibacillus flagellatus]